MENSEETSKMDGKVSGLALTDRLGSGRRPYLLCSGRARQARRPAATSERPIQLSADREIRGEERFVVDLNQDRVIAGLGKRQIANFVDEIDAVQRAL
jgi:hypothetical protein